MLIQRICFALLILAFASVTTFNGRVVAGDKKSPAPIIKPGEYKLYDGKMAIKVTEEKGKLDYDIKVTHPDGSVGSTGSKGSTSLKKEGAVWVIYPESNSKVLIFWGDKLIRFEVTVKKGVPIPGQEIVATDPGVAIAAMPKLMVEALPKEFVEKHKGKK